MISRLLAAAILIWLAEPLMAQLPPVFNTKGSSAVRSNWQQKPLPVHYQTGKVL